jgi:hypothetical protein
MHLTGTIPFKIRFNTQHGDTNLFWRVIIGDDLYLATAIDCRVPTYSDASFDARQNAMKYNLAGVCNEFIIDEEERAILK